MHTLTPPSIHAQRLTGTDVATREPVERVVVWADHVVDTCTDCHEPIPRDPGCPVLVHFGDGHGSQLEETDRKHGCGHWLMVDWVEVVPAGDAVTDEEIRVVAEQLHAQRTAEVERERGALRESLRRDLREVIAAEDEPLDDGETVEDRRDDLRSVGWTRDEGIDHDGTRWIAWSEDIDGGDAITVTPDDL